MKSDRDTTKQTPSGRGDGTAHGGRLLCRPDRAPTSSGLVGTPRNDTGRWVLLWLAPVALHFALGSAPALCQDPVVYVQKPIPQADKSLDLVAVARVSFHDEAFNFRIPSAELGHRATWSLAGPAGEELKRSLKKNVHYFARVKGVRRWTKRLVAANVPDGTPPERHEFEFELAETQWLKTETEYYEEVAQVEDLSAQARTAVIQGQVSQAVERYGNLVARAEEIDYNPAVEGAFGTFEGRAPEELPWKAIIASLERISEAERTVRGKPGGLVEALAWLTVYSQWQFGLPFDPTSSDDPNEVSQFNESRNKFAGIARNELVNRLRDGEIKLSRKDLASIVKEHGPQKPVVLGYLCYEAGLYPLCFEALSESVPHEQDRKIAQKHWKDLKGWITDRKDFFDRFSPKRLRRVLGRLASLLKGFQGQPRFPALVEEGIALAETVARRYPQVRFSPSLERVSAEMKGWIE